MSNDTRRGNRGGADRGNPDGSAATRARNGAGNGDPALPPPVANGGGNNGSPPSDTGNDTPRKTSYLLTDDEKRHRMWAAILIWGATLILFLSVGRLVVEGLFGASYYWSLIIGLASWFVVAGNTANHFLVSVPEITGLITVNLLRRPTEEDPYANMHVYPTGMHFKYAWEQVKEGLHINLRTVAQEFDEEIPASDGGVLAFNGSFQYNPLLKLLPRHISLDDTVIKRGLVDMINSILNIRVSGTPAKEAREGLGGHQDEIRNAFEEGRDIARGLEFRYGIDIRQVSLASIDFEKTLQKAMTTRRSVEEINAAARSLMEEAKKMGQALSFKEAKNAVLILNGTVSKSVFEAEGEGAQALGSYLTMLFAARGG